ncbi:MAG TPA: hypothetical protein VHR97_01065 [Candidatus Baltobacteraceae bacterium]|jgi:hypothetical protein|nr:hypothetical protein [Candidatus Baltobacteraceae bacterium]
MTGRIWAAMMLALCFTPAAAPAQSAASSTTRDTHKGFDFLIGTWRTHYRILRRRLRHDNVWGDCYGRSTVTPFWNGSGNLEDGDLRCPPPRNYVHGVTLRLYSAGTHQWSIYWGTTKLGLAMPPQVGHFNSAGVGDFYAHDTYEGTPVIVRYEWSLRAGGHPRFEQAFSTDEGHTWEVNWTTDYTRI